MSQMTCAVDMFEKARKKSFCKGVGRIFYQSWTLYSVTLLLYKNQIFKKKKKKCALQNFILIFSSQTELEN